MYVCVGILREEKRRVRHACGGDRKRQRRE